MECFQESLIKGDGVAPDATATPSAPPAAPTTLPAAPDTPPVTPPVTPPTDALNQSPSISDELIARYDQKLLGGSPAFTVRQIAELTNEPIEEVRRFWVAMGFSTVEPDELVFTEEDLAFYKRWIDLVRSGTIDLATARSLIQAQSHLTDRLTLWQVEALIEDMVRRSDIRDTQARAMVIEQMIDDVDLFQDAMLYTWKRQLHALVNRTVRDINERHESDSQKQRFPLNRTLGFVDMVSYTSSSSILGGKLVGLIQQFEEASRTTVAEAGGRVVKMMGDAVFYVADDLSTGIRVVTDLIDRLGMDEEILPVRASIVRGDVFSRSGDVFGPTVNLASRLVDVAPAGKILTDPATATAIAAGEGGEGYRLRSFPTSELRGFGEVSPYLLSRTFDS